MNSKFEVLENTSNFIFVNQILMYNNHELRTISNKKENLNIIYVQYYSSILSF